MPRRLQAFKIRELGEALVTAGYMTLDKQAKALGVCRSTAWTIIQGTHKNSGLSATVINRMLASPQLPPSVRAKLIEYVEEKIAGRYGHGKDQLREFAGRLALSPNVVWLHAAKQRTGSDRAVSAAPDRAIAARSSAR